MPPRNAPKSLTNPNPAATSPGGGTFDFEKFNADLQEQNRLTAERQAEQVRVAQTQSDIMQRSTQLAQEQFKSIQFLKDDVEIARQKASHGRALADSMNPIDQLRLVGLQTMDPNGYIRKNREARLREDAGQAAILSQYFSQGQQALQSELASATGELNTLKTLEAIGREKLLSYSDSAALMRQNLTAVHGMREDVIQGLDVPEISAAIQEAKASENGMVNIAGVDVDARTLEDRLTALRDREYLQLTHKTALDLAKDDAEHVPDVLAQREYERKVNKDLQENFGVDQQIKQGQRNVQVSDLIKATQERIISTYSMKELQDLRKNNYKSPTGTQYDPATVEAAYGVKKNAQTEMIQTQVNENALQNFDIQAVASEATRVEGMISRFKEGTPVAAAAREYRTALGITALGVGAENGIVTRIAAMEGYTAARDKFDKVLQSQAKLDGKGDKDVEDLRLEYYRGNPVPQEALTNATTKRLNNFKSVADLFPPEIATKIESKYRELVQIKMQRGMLDATMSESDRKLARDAAAQEAVAFGVNQGLAGQTESIVAGQVDDPSHPLHGRMTPVQFATTVAQADSIAFDTWKSANNLSDAEVATVMSGGNVPGKPDVATLTAQRQFTENQTLLQILDGIQPGLGHETAEWWQQKGGNYIGNVSQTISNSASGTFQGNNFLSQAGSTVGRQFNEYATGLAQADSQFQAQMLKRNTDLLTFGSTPGRAQIAILHNDKSLSDDERKQIYSQVIHPILDEAMKKGLDYEQTNIYVERAIQNYVPQDPMMKELMRIVKKDRPAILEQLNSWSATFGRLLPTGDAGGRIGNDGTTSTWYQQYLKESGQMPEYKPWFKIGPLQIGGDVAAYERMRAERNR